MSHVQIVELEESSTTVGNGTACVSSVPRNPPRNSFSARGHQLINNQNYCQKLKKILNPGGPHWNWFFLGVYVLSISLDSSFFYILSIDGCSECLALVKNLAFALVVFRSLFDIFHVIYVIFESDNADVDVPGNNSWAINARKYLHCINAILSILPIPLGLLFVVVPKMRGLEFEVAMSWLKYLVLAQYVPRTIRTYQLFKRATNGAGVYAVTLANAAFSFLVFLIVSHGFGALRYFIAIERVTVCWRQACKSSGCIHDSFLCDQYLGDRRILNTLCPIKIRDPTVFNFGMFHDALQTGIVEVTTNFHQKFLYCFQWGIRSLCGSEIVWIIFIVENLCSERTRQLLRMMFMMISIRNCIDASSAKNCGTSVYLSESLFSLVMTITGVALISSLFENVKKLLQYYYKEISAKMQMQEIEKCRLFQMLCDDLQQEVRNYHQTVRQATEDFNVYQFFNELPRGTNRKFKLQLCSPVLEKVFDRIDEHFLNAMLDLLKLVPYTERSILVHEGSGVEKMFFIVRGKIWSEPTTIRTTTFSFNASNDGHFCGEELLPRASVLQLGGLPISTRTVIAHTPVEAFVIEADDWKQLVNSFMLPDDQLPYIFRLTQKI
ncbi:cyclic nucleotide-gated ion channel 1 isoform X2 [Citrus sinensis]|uniref:cyclic nucleotide-gated ion channel 1 isoform X1 n=1 Tax=Citrus clementina TaxID=85681 RepID=UPI000CED7345|nr:cyclic nucleotide-gated ion channel 1 isoform X1 [Citrus x clementina]XP_024958354.1 cyclic nucleotide-gated ion channel 1 isoform X1 [Citrus sinensis]XP_024958355.1 cyclic nucleotide-gated ion channel 1 isoform X2 [Citrus sinensis]